MRIKEEAEVDMHKEEGSKEGIEHRRTSCKPHCRCSSHCSCSCDCWSYHSLDTMQFATRRVRMPGASRNCGHVQATHSKLLRLDHIHDTQYTALFVWCIKASHNPCRDDILGRFWFNPYRLCDDHNKSLRATGFVKPWGGGPGTH